MVGGTVFIFERNVPPLAMMSHFFRERDLHSKDWKTRRTASSTRSSSTFHFRSTACQLRAICVLDALSVDLCWYESASPEGIER